MDSFLKDALSALILAGWVFPVLYLTLALVAGKVLALFRHFTGRQDQPPHAPRSRRVRSVIPSSAQPAVAARRAPVAAAGVAMPVARISRPRVASRWKSSQRLSAGTC